MAFPVHRNITWPIPPHLHIFIQLLIFLIILWLLSILKLYLLISYLCENLTLYLLMCRQFVFKGGYLVCSSLGIIINRFEDMFFLFLQYLLAIVTTHGNVVKITRTISKNLWITVAIARDWWMFHFVIIVALVNVVDHIWLELNIR